MADDKVFVLKRELCANAGGHLIPRLCPKCGDQADVHVHHISTVRKNAFGCDQHFTEVRDEIKRGAGMWPSDWFGRVRRDRYGNWLNLFAYTFED